MGVPTHWLSGLVGGVKACAGGCAPCGLRHGDSADWGHAYRLGGVVEGGLQGAGAGGLCRGGCLGARALAQPASAHSGARGTVGSQATPCAAAAQGEWERLKSSV